MGGPVERLGQELPEPSKDTMLNLSTVLTGGSLGVAQTWGVALASAIATRNPRLRSAVLAEARERVDDGVIDDAVAAASLMAMNNVYYRFRHMIGKESYRKLPARLRMNRIARPAGSRADFELFCLAVSAVNGCEACVRAHEQVLVEASVSEAQIHDAVRIAATLCSAAVALEAGELLDTNASAAA